MVHIIWERSNWQFDIGFSVMVEAKVLLECMQERKEAKWMTVWLAGLRNRHIRLLFPTP